MIALRYDEFEQTLCFDVSRFSTLTVVIKTSAFYAWLDAERISFVAIAREISTESVEDSVDINEIGPIFFDPKMIPIGNRVRFGDVPVIVDELRIFFL